jgi:capsid portal protein
MGGIQSILLNYESSLFRRRFYENGGHIGYIEPIKVIPINNKTIKDEFYKIKEITESELCACHRIPDSLAAVMPNSKGSFLALKNN